MAPVHPGTVTLPLALRSRLRALERRLGTLGTADHLGVSRRVVERALAGLGIRRGSARLLVDALDPTPTPCTADDDLEVG